MTMDTMPAGREMDAAIAEKVMGWKYSDEHCVIGEAILGKRDPVYANFVDGEIGVSRPENWGVWSPSTSISAAWEVVEKMDLLGTGMLGKNKNGDWAIWDNGENELPIFADTAPLAICRAALKAISNEK